MFEWLKDFFGLTPKPTVEKTEPECEECGDDLNSDGECDSCVEDFDWDEEEEEEDDDDEDEEEKPSTTSHFEPLPNLSSIVLEAFKEASDEIAAKEKKLWDDQKLAKYVKEITKQLLKDLIHDSGKYDFVLIYPDKAGVPAEIRESFFKILQGLYKELEIHLDRGADSDYFSVNKASAKKALEKLRKTPIDIDERIQSLLHKGPYR